MKYSVVLQHSETDCGAACLGAICQHYGRTLTLNTLREAVGTGQLGTTMLGLRRGATSLGLNARPVRASPNIVDQLKSASLPAIIHWQGHHWVVLHGQRRNKYIIADPAIGIRYVSRQELIEGWLDWVMLLLEPDPSRFHDQPDEKTDRGLGRFFQQLWAYRRTLIGALICAQIIGLLSLAYPFLIQILTDDVLIRGDRQLLTGLAIAVIAMNLVSAWLELVEYNLITHFAQKLELGLVLEFARTLLRLPLTYFEARRSGEIVSRLEDVQEINQLVAQTVISIPSRLFIAIISFGFMVFYSQSLTLVVIAIAMVMTISTTILLPTLQQKVRRVMVLDSENQGVLVETFKGALTLKTTAAAPQLWEEMQLRFGSFANQTYRTAQIGIFNFTFSKLVSSIGSITLLWYGSTLVFSDKLSIGQLLAFNSMTANFLGLISTLIQFVDEWTRVRTAIDRITEIIEHTPESQIDKNKPVVKLANKADIICEDVSFSYPGRVELLQDFSLNIPGGQVTALIGKSGCGKSTLTKLIANLYSTQTGNISIGLYNQSDIDLDCWRQQVVLIPQDAHFWSRSIIENFTLGNPQVSFEQILQACNIAGADEFIRKMPDKYQTILGEFGANLSGGQKQRLAIARAIVNNPPVLILDESTGALDPVSEHQVLERLLYHRHNKTTVMISHRPKVIERADWIVMLDQGKLQIQGTPAELSHLSGEHLDFFDRPFAQDNSNGQKAIRGF
ncbi:MAG: peptidase domain-containing ABC transporter [Pleurocapsa minor HA4230-MV1]|nr:peptidase domain-containing ABC transporter [Pleurocapsa minor HA4230-MV1]